MNLLFRKNFREGANKSSGGGSKLQTKSNRTKRSRETGGGGGGGGINSNEEIHYRTHLFFAPSRGGYEPPEEKCSGISGFSNQLPSTATAPSSSSYNFGEVEAPQPLVDRRPSFSLLRWNQSIKSRNENTVYQLNSTTYEQHQQLHQQQQQQQQQQAKQLYTANSNNYNHAQPTSTTMSSTTSAYNADRQVNKTNASNAVAGRSEPISLATLDRDCFIIPVNSVDRFLPAGIPLPAPSTDVSGKSTSPLSVLEVSDPKLCILVHLMSPLEPIDPLLESPLSHPLLKQRAVAAELLTEVQQANTAVGGMLLANMEKSEEFPFIAYYLLNTTQTDPANFYSGIRVASLSKFEPKTLKYTAAHTLDLYSEVAAICRPPLTLAPNESGSFKRTQTPATGYIITVFKVFEGDDGERFEKNWLYWTGARMLYRYLPRTAGLRRIALHKSTAQKGDKMYLLVCECSDLLKDVAAAAVLIPAMRARLCGYTGLYRPIQVF